MKTLIGLLNLAQQHVVGGDLKSAREALHSALAQAPEHPGALLQLSYVESLSGHYRFAQEYALRAHATQPRDASTLMELARRLRTFNQVAALHECLRELPPLRQTGIPVLLSFGAQLSYLNEQERALELLDEAKRGDPDYPPTLIARGQVLTYLGRFDEAEADLLRCTRRAPELASAWWALSRLRRQAAESNHIDAIRKQLAVPGRRAEDVALLGYALHKEYDDLGETRHAWQALELACRAKRSTLRYAKEETRALVDALMAMPVPTVPSVDPAPAEGPVPIFIVGMHRSGTTLLEQLLDGHAAVRGLGELYDFTSQMRHAADHHCRGVIDGVMVERASQVDFRAAGAGYLDGIAWRLGDERFFTDKLPSNFLNIGFICRALPNAKILHMRRDPMETCFSNLRELFSDANAYSYDQGELADYHRQYQRLMAHWHRSFPGRIHDVDYGELTVNPEAVLRGVSAFCGLDFEPGMLDLHSRTRGVATASAVQVRQRLARPERPKWTAYAPWLGSLQAALRPDVL
ncbi:tetratricopeptide repeat-containing sulfotransferase family protein [Lysobacter cavernae]|uniref:Tetratricopeptide repeat-containing sulfotransferase family protein n=1 Tax=Lysobacter cavernae TaxID=1685901 RepID=A0ABV7RMT1_9GAMM